MLKSMTGFGRGEYLDHEHRFIVEIKAVNHRYNEIAVRMPKNLISLEDKIRRSVSSSLVRGRIDIYISMDEYGEKKRLLRVDKELAMAYHKALRELAEHLSIPAHDSVQHIAKLPDVIRAEEVNDGLEMIWVKLSQAVETAIVNLVSMRLAEGANIEDDLTKRLEKLLDCVQMIEHRAPLALAEHQEKLLNRMRDVLSAVGAAPDEIRLIQEVALFAERTNVTEELVRLKSHLEQFNTALKSDTSVGRKLDFLIQEINREANTIASKANDFSIANIVIEIKSEIEKVREQIQNIE